MIKSIKKWIFAILFVTSLIGISYSVPHYKVGTINGAEVKRVDAKTKVKGEDPSRTRDVYYVSLKELDGSPWVMRNEDTGWGLPLYFKFNSADLHSIAQGYDDSNTQVAVKYYGWRSNLFSWFPNALSVKEHQGESAPVSISAWGVFTLFFVFWITIYFKFIREGRENAS